MSASRALCTGRIWCHSQGPLSRQGSPGAGPLNTSARTARRIAVILPPRESFAPGRAGAIALLVHRLADASETIIGVEAGDTPYPDAIFLPATPPFWPLFGSGRYAAGVARVMRRIRPDAVEIHNRPELALALRRRFPDLPMRLVLHNDPQTMRRAETPEKRMRLGREIAVAAVSDWVRDRFLEGVTGVSVEVLPNCIDRAALPTVLPQDERQPLILFAGRVVADKGADAFVAACATVLPELPGWRAEMIGADRFGPDSPETPFLAALRPKAEAAGVMMSGYQPYDRVLAAMARAAILVVPSRWPEPFGLVALEGMACGAAVIASPNGALGTLVGGAGMLADPDAPDALADAIRQLATDPARRVELAVAGVARAAAFDLPAARMRRAAARFLPLSGS